jgi:flagellar biosynthesis/type III secretory pathway protein FliH
MAKKVKPLSPAALKQRWDHYAVMEHATTTAWQSGYAEGLEKGRVLGYAEGFEEGRVLGYAEGFEEGRVLGYAEGLEEVRVAGKAIGKVAGMRAQQIIIAVELRKLGFEEAKIAEVLQIDIEELKLL